MQALWIKQALPAPTLPAWPAHVVELTILGNAEFAIDLGRARPNSAASLFLALARDRLSLPREGCNL